MKNKRVTVSTSLTKEVFEAAQKARGQAPLAEFVRSAVETHLQLKQYAAIAKDVKKTAGIVVAYDPSISSKGTTADFLARHEKPERTINHKPIRPVVAINTAGDRLTFPNAKAAGKALGLSGTAISTVLKGKQKSAKGFRFEYEAVK